MSGPWAMVMMFHVMVWWVRETPLPCRILPSNPSYVSYISLSAPAHSKFPPHLVPLDQDLHSPGVVPLHLVPQLFQFLSLPHLLNPLTHLVSQLDYFYINDTFDALTWLFKPGKQSRLALVEKDNVQQMEFTIFNMLLILLQARVWHRDTETQRHINTGKRII